MSIRDEAIEAMARAAWGTDWPQSWDKLGEGVKNIVRNEQRRVLSALLDLAEQHGARLWVPKEATEPMCLAGHDIVSDHNTGIPTLRSVDEIWAAMIDAAPDPLKEPDHDR